MLLVVATSVLVGGAVVVGGGEAELGPRRERRVGGEADLSRGVGDADLACQLGFPLRESGGA